MVALVFGAWLRRTEYTADRVGSLCAGSFSNALGAISITTFHAIGRRVDMHVLAEQRHELKAEPALRMGEWLGGMPYATNRISALVAFRAQPQTAFWQEALKLPRPVAVALEPGGKRVVRRDTAPLWRRLGALFIDLTVLGAILNSTISDQPAQSGTVGKEALSDVPAALQPLIEWAIHHHLSYSIAGAGVVFLMLSFFVYSAILVGVSGQTLGMMIMELRVVTTNFARPGLLRVLWRYSGRAGRLGDGDRPRRLLRAGPSARQALGHPPRAGKEAAYLNLVRPSHVSVFLEKLWKPDNASGHTTPEFSNGAL